MCADSNNDHGSIRVKVFSILCLMYCLTVMAMQSLPQFVLLDMYVL